MTLGKLCQLDLIVWAGLCCQPKRKNSRKLSACGRAIAWAPRREIRGSWLISSLRFSSIIKGSWPCSSAGAGRSRASSGLAVSRFWCSWKIVPGEATMMSLAPRWEGLSWKNLREGFEVQGGRRERQIQIGWISPTRQWVWWLKECVVMDEKPGVFLLFMGPSKLDFPQRWRYELLSLKPGLSIDMGLPWSYLSATWRGRCLLISEVWEYSSGAFSDGPSLLHLTCLEDEEPWVQSDQIPDPEWKDPLEEEMAAPLVFFPENPWTKRILARTVSGLQAVEHDWAWLSFAPGLVVASPHIMHVNNTALPVRFIYAQKIKHVIFPRRLNNILLAGWAQNKIAGHGIISLLIPPPHRALLSINKQLHILWFKKS